MCKKKFILALLGLSVFLVLPGCKQKTMQLPTSSYILDAETYSGMFQIGDG